MTLTPPGRVMAVSRSATHTFSKPVVQHIRVLPGLGVEGDARMGRTVKHRSHVARDPTQPNQRDAIRVETPPLPYRTLAPV